MVDTSMGVEVPAGAEPAYTARYRNLVLFLLSAAYAVNFIDRTIIVTIGQAIKADLNISDTQLGLLGGLYFALLYSIMGVPIARFADRLNRVNILAVSMVVWSGFTALCGTASNFFMLSVYRFGVGLGEAGLHPPAHSLISDYFPRSRRARALAIFAIGVPIGTMLGALMGGWLTQNFSWRVAFVIVGIPGVILAVIIKMVMREPPRGYADTVLEPTGAPARLVQAEIKGVGGELAETGRVARLLFGRWPLLNMMLGIGLAAFAGFGAGQFSAPYFIRAFGLNYAQVGAIMGLLGGASSIVGNYLGGYLSDRLGARRDARFYALVPGIGLLIAFPLALAVYHAPSWPTAAALLLFPGMFAGTYMASTFAVVQNASPSHQRATAAAILMFVMNIIGMGGGPVFSGWLIDHLASFHLAHPGPMVLWQSLTHVFEAGLAPFKDSCPAGAAAKALSAEAQGACRTALVTATREGIITSYCAWIWAAAHFLLASIGMREALARKPA